ncbi:hypothetical protein TWF718_005730 [Orbilia javanica]|uniref:Uncharacterized protein n=1 Tax=Orbilia javanica TaxID=47235 RepID=A0AAN8N873_9PEZI
MTKLTFSLAHAYQHLPARKFRQARRSSLRKINTRWSSRLFRFKDIPEFPKATAKIGREAEPEITRTQLDFRAGHHSFNISKSLDPDYNLRIEVPIRHQPDQDASFRCGLSSPAAKAAEAAEAKAKVAEAVVKAEVEAFAKALAKAIAEAEDRAKARAKASSRLPLKMRFPPPGVVRSSEALKNLSYVGRRVVQRTQLDLRVDYGSFVIDTLLDPEHEITIEVPFRVKPFLADLVSLVDQISKIVVPILAVLALL